jgi:FkbH-like protein
MTSREKILELLAESTEHTLAEVSAIDNDMPVKELGLDSLKFIQMIVRFEEKFEIEVYDSDLVMSNFQTIGALLQTFQKYLPDAALKKVLICDCDNVLWNGIVGEESIFMDERNVRFQNMLIELYGKGILLCLCSRNLQEHIDQAFANLKMPLEKKHIIISKINIDNKAENIKAISNELNLSADSFVFVDDSDYELGLINTLLPEVETVKADYSNMIFLDEIKSLFGEQSAQDINRTQLYIQQKEREKTKLHVSTIEEYNNSLETKWVCAIDDITQAERVAELSQRTNQFNLSGTRYDKEQITEFMEDERKHIISLSVSDKYGEMGIIGAAVVSVFENTAVIDSFFLSCRAFDRGFEVVLIEKIKKCCGDKSLSGVYIPTDKNARYADFYAENGVLSHESI